SWGAFTKVSPASRALLGLEPEELLQKRYVEIVADEDRENTSSELKGSKSGSKSFECRLMRKDGSIISTLWSVTWSEADDSFICVAHDITERKQMERLKEEFVSMVSHDLRTPLTSVQNYLYLLAEGTYGKLNTVGKERLPAMERSIDR